MQLWATYTVHETMDRSVGRRVADLSPAMPEATVCKCGDGRDAGRHCAGADAAAHRPDERGQRRRRRRLEKKCRGSVVCYGRAVRVLRALFTQRARKSPEERHGPEVGRFSATGRRFVIPEPRVASVTRVVP